MKKILIMLSLLASVQLFSANYKVVVQSNLTQQEINKNNVQIEKAAQRDYGRALTEILSKTAKEEITPIIGAAMSLIEVENEDIKAMIGTEMLKGYDGIISLVSSKIEFKILKVRYVASNAVEVTLKIKEPDILNILAKAYDFDFESSIIGKIAMSVQKNLSEEELKKEIVKILFDNKKQLKDVTEVEFYKKMIELMINEITVNVEKLLKEEENYDEDEISFYLEKNGDKWEIPELEEKIKSLQEIIKSLQEIEF